LPWIVVPLIKQNPSGCNCRCIRMSGSNQFRKSTVQLQSISKKPTDFEGERRVLLWAVAQEITSQLSYEVPHFPK